MKTLLITALVTIATCSTQSQPQTSKVKIGSENIELNVITSEAERQRLFERLGDLSDGNGTLVCYNHDRYLHFFGPKTDLDVIFLSSDSTIVDIKQLKKLTATDIRDDEGATSSKEARYALFVKSGHAKKLGVKAGDKITLTDEIKNQKIQEMSNVTIKGKKVYVEIVYTYRARSRGLMHRPNLSENDGMLFMYPEAQSLSFWMKNTKLPLSIAYIKPDGTITDTLDMKPFDESSHPSSGDVQFALEVNQGWYKKNDIKVGDKVTIPDEIRSLVNIKFVTAKFGENAIDLDVVATDSDRRSLFERIDRLPDNRGYLICHAHDRFLHYFGPKADMDVIFLDSSANVVDIQGLAMRTKSDIIDEIGITTAKEARFAMFINTGNAKRLGIKVGGKIEFSDEFTEIKIQEMPAVTIKGKKAFVEFVYTWEDRSRGLMHRPKMSRDDGMIFLYPKPKTMSFYMKNTLIPLSIAYTKSDGTISEILDLPPKDDKGRPSKEHCQFVLEMNLGWFSDNGIKPGDKIEIPQELLKLPAEG